MRTPSLGMTYNERGARDASDASRAQVSFFFFFLYISNDFPLIDYILAPNRENEDNGRARDASGASRDLVSLFSSFFIWIQDTGASRVTDIIFFLSLLIFINITIKLCVQKTSR